MQTLIMYFLMLTSSVVSTPDVKASTEKKNASEKEVISCPITIVALDSIPTTSILLNNNQNV